MNDTSLQLKLNDIDIPENNPFTNDQLGRQDCANTLTGLVSNITGPLVVSINGGWGTGKTIFLRMWQQDLKNKGFTTIYFSAWDDDYSDDALVALIGQIWNNFKESNYKEIVNSIKECTAPVFRSTIFNTIKTATAGIVDLSEEKLKSISERAVDEYLTAGEKLKDLKRRLSTLAKKVLENNKPLVIIVDELDRCRPLFAIELLEKVKHLFDIPGIIFVLGVDREQLGHSIKSVYGQNMKVDGYLRRFVDLNFELPGHNTTIFVKYLLGKFGLTVFFAKRMQSTKYRHADESDTFITSFAALAKVFNLSLRDIEHCIGVLALIAGNTEEQQMLLPFLLSPLIIIRHMNKELYSEFVTSKCNSEKIIEYILKQPAGEEYMNDTRKHLGIFTEAFLLAVSPNDWEKKITSQLQLLIEDKEPTITDLPKRYLSMSKDRMDKFMRYYGHVKQFNLDGIDTWAIKHLTDKIELASLATEQ